MINHLGTRQDVASNRVTILSCSSRVGVWMASFFCGWYNIAVCYSPQTNYGACWLADHYSRRSACCCWRGQQPSSSFVLRSAAVIVLTCRRSTAELRSSWFSFGAKKSTLLMFLFIALEMNINGDTKSGQNIKQTAAGDALWLFCCLLTTRWRLKTITFKDLSQKTNGMKTSLITKGCNHGFCVQWACTPL